MNKYGFRAEEIKASNAQLMKHIITILPVLIVALGLCGSA
jgi:hypothetical protein